MPYSGARAHPLSVTRANDGAISHAVFMFQGTLQHVSNDLHVAMRVHGKTVAVLDRVFIDHAQGVKSHEAGVIILIKRKGEMSVEPAEIASTTFVTVSNVDHSQILVITTI